MGRVLPVKKYHKSHIIRTPIKVEPVDWLECPVCGKERVEVVCPHCQAYHAPQKCEGEGCKICAEVKYLEESKKIKLTKEKGQ